MAFCWLSCSSDSAVCEHGWVWSWGVCMCVCVGGWLNIFPNNLDTVIDQYGALILELAGEKVVCWGMEATWGEG